MSFLSFLRKLFHGEDPSPSLEEIEEPLGSSELNTECSSLRDTNIQELPDGTRLFIPPSVKK